MLYEADGYLLTDCWCESPQKRQYRVRDFWKWHKNFESFRARFQSRYGEFEKRILSDRLIEKEQFLGAYYEEQAGGDDLVPS
jgi:hypothetical protein